MLRQLRNTTDSPNTAWLGGRGWSWAAEHVGSCPRSCSSTLQTCLRPREAHGSLLFPLLHNDRFTGSTDWVPGTSLIQRKRQESSHTLAGTHAKQLQLCPTLCNPTDGSPPGSSVRGILQARILEWVAMPSSRGSSQPRDWTHVSYVSCTGRWVLYL